MQSSTAMFVAKLRDEVVSTVSLVCDDKLGLPISRIYAERGRAATAGMGLALAKSPAWRTDASTCARRIALLIGLFRIHGPSTRVEKDSISS